jgi:nicotinate phosphoribosyltransferase
MSTSERFLAVVPAAGSGTRVGGPLPKQYLPLAGRTVLECSGRALLEEAGLSDAMIFASSGFDEYKISDVMEKGAPLDGFGVGTNVGVAKDSPYLDMAYKLVKYDGRPVLKLSTKKKTLPCEKQVYRLFDDEGLFREDIIAIREEEAVPGGTALLERVMENGKRILHEPLADIRTRCAESLKRIPLPVAAISRPQEYSTSESKQLQRQKETLEELSQRQIINH